jgi:PhnB protein
MSAKVNPIAPGFNTLTPHLVIKGAAKAIDFYKKIFGATEVSRMPMPDGKIMHASLQIGNSILMLADESPDWGSFGPQNGGSPVTIHLYVPDVDKTYNAAVAAGAKAVMPPQDLFWGDRYGKLIDPFGHHWSVATHIQDLTPEQIAEGAKKAMAEGCSGSKE